MKLKTIGSLFNMAVGKGSAVSYPRSPTFDLFRKPKIALAESAERSVPCAENNKNAVRAAEEDLFPWEAVN